MRALSFNGSAINKDVTLAYHFKSIILGEQGKYDEAFSVLIDAQELIGKKVISSIFRVVNSISTNVFNNAKVEMDLCDDKFDKMMAINP